MARSVLLLGSNLGNKSEILNKAISAISESCGHVEQKSQVYETEPWGYKSNDSFYNQVVSIETELLPRNLLSQLLKIEKSLGRTRSVSGYSSRTIDLDILFFDNELIENNDLVIPHPRLHERRFTLEPLVEICPDFVHPVLKKTITLLLKECKDQCKVKKLDQEIS